MKITALLFSTIFFLSIQSCSSDSDATIENIPVNPQITQPESFKAIVGGLTQLGIKEDGSLWAWGKNVTGLMGNGQTQDAYYSFAPSQIGIDTNWKSIANLGAWAAGIKNDGTLWRWGVVQNLETNHTEFIPFPEQFGTDSNWKKIAGYGAYFVGIKDDGTLWGWGMDIYIGFGNTNNYHLTPVLISDDLWMDVQGGANHTLLLKGDGTIWVTGSNGSGRLGNGTLDFSTYSLTQVGTESNWKHIFTDIESNLAIKEDGSLWAWGMNALGQLGVGNNAAVLSPTQIGSDHNWEMVAMGNGSTIFLQNDGTIWGCGLFMNKFIGSSINSVSQTYSPVQLENDSDWNYVHATNGAVYAKKANDETWGIGYSWALGITTDNFFNLQVTKVAWDN